MANHPAEIDPSILLRILWPCFQPRPVAVDFLFQNPILRHFLHLVGALSVPNFEDSSNSFKKKQIEATYEELFGLLRQGKNLLIYPAGGLKRQAEEVIGGASGVHEILEVNPEVNIVLIRTLGLWGSTFSRAITGKSPDIIQTFLNGFKVLLKNVIFFTPRRDVEVEIQVARSDFPYKTTRRELNLYLENWYNAKGPEPLTLVSYSAWRKVVPKVVEQAQREKRIEGPIPEEIQKKVIEEIARFTSVSTAALKPSQELAIDLGLDSLDLAQLVFFIKENFGVNNVHSSDLVTVEDVMAFAARLKKSRREEQEEKQVSGWHKEDNRPKPNSPEGETVIEAFFNVCQKNG